MFTPMKSLILFFCLLGVAPAASAAMYALYLNQSTYTVKITELSNQNKVTELRTGESFKTPKVLSKEMNHQLELLDNNGVVVKTLEIQDINQRCNKKWNYVHPLQPEYTAIALDKTTPESSWSKSICLSGFIARFIGLRVTIQDNDIVLEQGLAE